jgi:hypothetical protein
MEKCMRNIVEKAQQKDFHSKESEKKNGKE